MKITHRLGLLSLLLIVSALLVRPVSLAQTGDLLYFPETGHRVQGEFYLFYKKAMDPTTVYGYPITDAFQNPTTGRIVQYFQRAYVELYPENAPDQRVKRIPLGVVLFTPGEQLGTPPDLTACRYFQETGSSVCYAFLDFFNANGGLEQFGNPISDMVLINERIVQYFEYARFEWRPELPSGQRVALADLGRLYFEARNEDPIRGQPDLSAPRTILELSVRAFPEKAATDIKAEQTIYVTVQDQNDAPVSQAQVTVTVKYPSGEEINRVMPSTNQNGITMMTFTIDETEYGMVEILVQANYGRLSKHTRTSFRIWY